MDEVWLGIPGYPGYEASDQGRVRSLDRVVKRSGVRGNALRKGVVLKPALVSPHEGEPPYRYARVSKTKMRKVAVLVLEAFVGPKPFPGAVGRHLNDDSLDDRLSNLTWGTQSQNVADAVRNGRRKPRLGEDCPAAKLTEVDVLAIRASAESGVKLAAQYGVHRATISDIITRKTWRHV